MSYGPQLPPHLQKQKDFIPDQKDESRNAEDNKDSTIYGPTLPPELTRSKSEKDSCESDSYGPKLPQGLSRANHYRDDTKPESGSGSDDDDFVGPIAPSDGGNTKTFRQEQISRQLDERARRIMEKGEEGDNQEAAPQRESWMLELPPEKAKNFGLGPRQFSKSSGPKPERDRSWTDTPEMKAKRAAMAAIGVQIKGIIIL